MRPAGLYALEHLAHSTLEHRQTMVDVICAYLRMPYTPALRAEQTLISMVASAYLLGVSTRRVDKLVETLGIASLSNSQASELAKSLDTAVEQFRNRPLDGGPYRLVQRPMR